MYVPTQDLFSELKRLGELLTRPDILPGPVWAASEQLYQLLLTASGMDMSRKDARKDLALPSGKALAPAWAAWCIRDFQRTRAFLRGILQAVRTIARQTAEPVHVLYAGTGPFASLVLPLIPLLEKEKVNFTLLDVHPSNIESLKKIIQTFGISERIFRIERADATTYRAGFRPHVLVVEMMQAGLQHEPQVSALLNLVPQLHPDAILIPQRISINAGLLHPARNHKRMMGSADEGEVYRLLGLAMELSLATIGSYGNPAVKDFPETVMEIPADREPGFRELALFTQIDVFDNERLGIWDCALTQPLSLTGLDMEPAKCRIGLRYQLGLDPGFQWRIIA